MVLNVFYRRKRHYSLRDNGDVSLIPGFVSILKYAIAEEYSSCEGCCALRLLLLMGR